MADLPCPPVWDVADLVGPSVRATANKILRYLNLRTPGWGYLPANGAMRLVIEHAKNPEQAAGYVGSGAPIGRLHNQEVARVVHGIIGNKGYMTRKIKYLRLSLDPTDSKFGPIIRPACILIRHDRPEILVVQYRKNFALDRSEWAHFAWLCKRAYATTDYAGLPFVFLDLAANAERKREPNFISTDDLQYLSDQAALELTQMFVEGFNLAKSEAPERVVRRRRKLEQVESTQLLF